MSWKSKNPKPMDRSRSLNAEIVEGFFERSMVSLVKMGSTRLASPASTGTWKSVRNSRVGLLGFIDFQPSHSFSTGCERCFRMTEPINCAPSFNAR